ncbi:related to single-stranded dna binding protein 12k chain [Melanopsichium pennsylvanicum]|uniref:Related to single-stranded dna binding protein 12k chain n=2 Tax=Melanopsichium pennsylvanicum TaxID=63383 RepID=A0AAJ4XPA7_9BASI|nr:related to single-stranded dna binding protein 12k chain [Melanopsichium pennsylvanicum 4]SNX86300.1 related to single-stranded dna binding protein 12k chain [Melanopsichium pennsylvanicum]
MDKPTPMINSNMLSQYANQTVRLVGKVQKITGNTLLLQTSDLGNVEVVLTPDSDISGSTFVEVTGKVSEGGSGMDGYLVREFTTVDCGDNVDMTLVENVVQISASFPQLFSGSS